MQRIVLTTGGTGGHIFPARVLAQKLIEKNYQVIILADENYSKYRKKEDLFIYHKISSAKLVKATIALFFGGLKIVCGFFQSLFWLLKYNPKAVVAFGGYATFPALLAAVLLKKKIILHEQNAHLGKVNRIFAKFAKKIALSFNKTDGIEEFLKEKTAFTGNPVRPEIVALAQNEYQAPNFNLQRKEDDLQKNLSDYGKNLGYDVVLHSQLQMLKAPKQIETEKTENKPSFNIFILGGSGGAKIFSDILPKAFFNLKEGIKNNLKIVMQCRSEQLEKTFSSYKSFNLNIVTNSFFEDIASELKKAHLVIARAGSSSLSELTCAKKPMILVPFATSADDHQKKNAKVLEKMSAAIVIEESELTINQITNLIEKLFNNPELLENLSKNAFKCSNLKATESLINLIESQIDE